MANSIPFNDLSAAFSELVRIYLPDSVKPIYSADEEERARAFIVLLHAEIEHYIERICKEVSERVVDSFMAGTISESAIAFLVFSGLPALNGGEHLGKKHKDSRKVSTQIHEALEKYEKLPGIMMGLEKNISQRCSFPWA